MNRTFAAIALAGALLCSCEPKPVGDVVLNGLVDVLPFTNDPALPVEVRNGTPVALKSASIICTDGFKRWSASLAKPLQGGHRIRVRTNYDPQDPARAMVFCGFTGAELEGAGHFIAAGSEIQAVIPSPEFH